MNQSKNFAPFFLTISLCYLVSSVSLPGKGVPSETASHQTSPVEFDAATKLVAEAWSNTLAANWEVVILKANEAARLHPDWEAPVLLQGIAHRERQEWDQTIGCFTKLLASFCTRESSHSYFGSKTIRKTIRVWL